MEKNLTQRPPIVTVLGHVDHGKTTLLDRIRNTNIATREAGGITQNIGGWQVKTKIGKEITFIDTPGHEAFQKMRSRGAKLADLAILVVAADDGVMLQTKESIKLIKEARIPFIVAITKVDLPGAQPERVKTQLLAEEVLLEGYGGDTVSVEVSAKTGQGIDDLLEMISLVSEVSGSGLVSSSLRKAEGPALSKAEGELEAPIIEAKLDRRKGVVVHAVVRDGELRIGQRISAGGLEAKIRGLFDAFGKPLREALPGMPIEILGFSELPEVGSVITRQSGAKRREEKARRTAEGEGLPIILKADTTGSLEAIEGKLGNKVNILFSGLGDISESDVLNARTGGGIIVGFNIRAGKELERRAEEEGVKIHIYRIIYELLDDVDIWIKEKEEKGKEKILGRAQVLAEFPHNKEKIAGCRMIEGRIVTSDRLRLIRDNQVVANMRAASLRKKKEKVEKVGEGEEFGIAFNPIIDFKVGDVVESIPGS